MERDRQQVAAAAADVAVAVEWGVGAARGAGY